MIVEGAGGLLVRLDTEGGTLLDLAAALASYGLSVEVVVVVAAGLGTLNHTELTVAALRARGIEPAGLVVGSWPADPGLAERCNLEDLPRVTGLPLLAVIPEGAGRLDRAEFVRRAPAWRAGRRPPPTGEDPAEVDRVDLDDLAVLAAGPVAAGRAGQGEAVRLTVPVRPLADHVVDDDAVVVGGEGHLAAGRPGEVDAVHPRVAGEDDVGDEADRPGLLDTVDHLTLGQGPRLGGSPGRAVGSSRPSARPGACRRRARRAGAEPNLATWCAVTASTPPPSFAAAFCWRIISRGDAAIRAMP